MDPTAAGRPASSAPGRASEDDNEVEHKVGEEEDEEDEVVRLRGSGERGQDAEGVSA